MFFGGMAERSNASDLKSEVGKPTEGSNPSPSLKESLPNEHRISFDRH